MAAALTRKSCVLAANFPVLATRCCCPSASLTFSRIQVRCKGHSQWQNRKFKKAHNDFARSKEFGKLSMEIITAVRGKAQFYKYAVSLCPAAGQVFQNTPCPAVKIKFLKISFSNVKSLFIWLNTVWGPVLGHKKRKLVFLTLE